MQQSFSDDSWCANQKATTQAIQVCTNYYLVHASCIEFHTTQGTQGSPLNRGHIGKATHKFSEGTDPTLLQNPFWYVLSYIFQTVTNPSTLRDQFSQSHMNYFISINRPPCVSASLVYIRSFQKSPRRAFTMSASSKEPRRFAPLRKGAVDTTSIPKLKGIVFDVDGTLWLVLYFC